MMGFSLKKNQFIHKTSYIHTHRGINGIFHCNFFKKFHEINIKCKLISRNFLQVKTLFSTLSLGIQLYFTVDFGVIAKKPTQKRWPEIQQEDKPKTG